MIDKVDGNKSAPSEVLHDQHNGSMFDPVKNAKVLGILFLVIGLIQLPFLVFGVGTSNSSVFSLISFLVEVILIVVAFGLFRAKNWAVYGFGFLTILSAIGVLTSFISDRSISMSNVGPLALEIIVFLCCFQESSGSMVVEKWLNLQDLQVHY